jgi:hypothetical protein
VRKEYRGSPDRSRACCPPARPFVEPSRTAGGEESVGAISFGFTLASAPTVRYINFGTPAPAECPGTATEPQATAGNLCVYEGVAPMNTTVRGEFDAVGGANNITTTFGAAVYADATAATAYRTRGSWAVTSS